MKTIYNDKLNYADHQSDELDGTPESLVSALLHNPFLIKQFNITINNDCVIYDPANVPAFIEFANEFCDDEYNIDDLSVDSLIRLFTLSFDYVSDTVYDEIRAALYVLVTSL